MVVTSESLSIVVQITMPAATAIPAFISTSLSVKSPLSTGNSGNSAWSRCTRSSCNSMATTGRSVCTSSRNTA